MPGNYTELSDKNRRLLCVETRQSVALLTCIDFDIGITPAPWRLERKHPNKNRFFIRRSLTGGVDLLTSTFLNPRAQRVSLSSHRFDVLSPGHNRIVRRRAYRLLKSARRLSVTVDASIAKVSRHAMVHFKTRFMASQSSGRSTVASLSRVSSPRRCQRIKEQPSICPACRWQG